MVGTPSLNQVWTEAGDPPQLSPSWQLVLPSMGKKSVTEMVFREKGGDFAFKVSSNARKGQLHPSRFYLTSLGPFQHRERNVAGCFGGRWGITVAFSLVRGSSSQKGTTNISIGVEQ